MDAGAMTTQVDPIFFKELAAAEPQDVCRRACCRHDADTRCYTLPVWGDDYAVYPEESTIRRLCNKMGIAHAYLDLFIVHYLLHAKAVDVRNTWISEKDIPGGATFFRGPHAIPTDLITKRYGDDLEAFVKSCHRLEGTVLDMADAAFAFCVAPRVPVAVLYFIGDDEFPAESRLLFDSSITDHLAADIVYALAVDVCARLSAL
jgi:hypothetical protein